MGVSVTCYILESLTWQVPSMVCYRRAPRLPLGEHCWLIMVTGVSVANGSFDPSFQTAYLHAIAKRRTEVS
jgi:hypothetical protein